MTDVNPAGWRRFLSINLGHLTQETMAASKVWRHEGAPLPMFGPHSFGFYCATISAEQAAPEGDWDDGPDDLRAVLVWAHEQGAEYVTFDEGGDWHDGLPDHSETLGEAEPCPVDQPPPGCIALTHEDACRALGCICPLVAASAALIAATETT